MHSEESEEEVIIVPLLLPQLNSQLLEAELLNGKQMEIYCPQADAATTNSTASATANIARDYKGKKRRTRTRHKRELLLSQMEEEEEEEEEEEKLGTFVHYLYSPLSFFPIHMALFLNDLVLDILDFIFLLYRNY